MSATEGTESVDERFKYLENKIVNLESRLATLEGHKQDNPEIQKNTSNIMVEEKEIKKAPFSVTLASKHFHKADFMTSDAGDRIDFVLAFKSYLDKDVRAFKGIVVIKDIFHQDIMRLTLTQETGIRASNTSEWKGGITFNQFLEPHQRLLSVDSKDTIVSFELENVVYTDGSRESFG